MGAEARALAARLLAAVQHPAAALAILSAAYVLRYLGLPSTPGNQPLAHPEGWWGWFDQGQYLKSAMALRARDLSPGSHFYPPLYPAVGALFLPWSSGHPFFIANLLALLWFGHVFLRVASMAVPRWVGLALLLATVVADPRVFENFVIPWTTTLATALLATGMLALVWLAEAGQGGRPLRSGALGLAALALGLVVAVRPPDAVLAAWLALALAAAYLRGLRRGRPGLPPPGRTTALALAGLVVGPLLSGGFNLLVFGELRGGYLQANAANGLPLADLPEKFISIWRDGALYGEPDAGLLQRRPWLYLGLPGLAWVLLRGAWPLRVVAVAIVLQQLVYLPFGDLLPNGLWRFLNIHYFKWAFPFLGLFGLLLAREVLTAVRGRLRAPAPALVAGLGALLLAGLALPLRFEPVQARRLEEALEVALPAHAVDFVDLPGASAGFTETYFGEHRAWLDGRPLRRIGDFRLLPMPGGTRVLFIRPVQGERLRLQPDARLPLPPEGSPVRAGEYRFGLQWRGRATVLPVGASD